MLNKSLGGRAVFLIISSSSIDLVHHFVKIVGSPTFSLLKHLSHKLIKFFLDCVGLIIHSLGRESVQLCLILKYLLRLSLSLLGESAVSIRLFRNLF